MKNINREILRLSTPNILSNIVIPLAGMVDVAIMGHLSSSIYIGAIAIGAMIFNFLYWGFGFLRMSTTGFTAQAFGAKDQQEMLLVFLRSAMIALTIAVLLLLFQTPIGWIAFKLVKGPVAVEKHARAYFSVRIWAAPATLMLYVFYGWFIGMQNSIIPAAIAIIVSLINIGASYFLVFHVGMKADGVALGTVIAQYSGLFLAVVFFLLRYKNLIRRFPLRQLVHKNIIRVFMLVNRDIFIRTLCLIAVMTFFTARSAVYGAEILAANTLLFQFFIFFSYFIDGFAYAGEALTGRFVGGRDSAQLKKMLRYLFLWGIGLSLIFTVIYIFFGPLLPTILTNDPDTIKTTGPFLFWTIIIPIVAFAAFLWDGIYIGATASVAMRNVMLIASALVFFPLYFIFDPVIGNHALWLALLSFLAARSIGMTAFSGKALKRQEKNKA